jgi:hypothetical protein
VLRAQDSLSVGTIQHWMYMLLVVHGKEAVR